jgi:hypothetical protein
LAVGGHVWSAFIKRHKAEFDRDLTMLALRRAPDGTVQRLGPQIETTHPHVLDHVVCVAWHLERRPPDGDTLLDLAQRWGGEKILLTGLGLAATLFDLALPDRIAVLIHGSPGVRRLIARQSRLPGLFALPLGCALLFGTAALLLVALGADCDKTVARFRRATNAHA